MSRGPFSRVGWHRSRSVQLGETNAVLYEAMVEDFDTDKDHGTTATVAADGPLTSETLRTEAECDAEQRRLPARTSATRRARRRPRSV